MHEVNMNMDAVIVAGSVMVTLDMVLSGDKEEPFQVEAIFYGSQDPVVWRLPLNAYLEAVYTGKMARCNDASLRVAPDMVVPRQLRLSGESMLLHLEGYASESGECSDVLISRTSLRLFCDKVGAAITAQFAALP